MKQIGFIGASGLMGHGIARNLLAKGYALSLTVHRNREGVADLLAAGAREVANPAELGACDAVILCVTGTRQVEACLGGEAVHQSLATASALGQGKAFVPALVTAQERLTGARIAPTR